MIFTLLHFFNSSTIPNTSSILILSLTLSKSSITIMCNESKPFDSNKNNSFSLAILCNTSLTLETDFHILEIPSNTSVAAPAIFPALLFFNTN